MNFLKNYNTAIDNDNKLSRKVKYANAKQKEKSEYIEVLLMTKN